MEEIKRFEAELRRLTKSKKISQKNKNTILKFINVLNANGIKKGTQAHVILNLHNIAKMLGKDFEKANKNDILKVVNKIEDRYKSEYYKVNLKVEIKRFYKWLRKTKDYPVEVEWIKTNRLKLCKFTKEELLTEDDVKKLADATFNLRDKCLIYLLWESGARISELLNLKIKDITFDAYGCVIKVIGKTGMRRIPIRKYVKPLLEWLDTHPQKTNNESYVFIPLENSKNPRIGKLDAEMMLKRIAKRAGITKRTNPHFFRHSRATYLAPRLREPIMRKLFGWSPSSRMPAIYYHIASEDVDQALLELNEIKVDVDELKPIETRECPNCGENNSILAHFCKKCHSFLDLSIVWKEKDNAVAMVIEKLKEDPMVVKKIKRIIKQLKLEKRFE